ncbi:MAG: hypothetical protein ACJA0P_003321, partial [Planctomycetota bacterium]
SDGPAFSALVAVMPDTDQPAVDAKRSTRGLSL